jgi:hypothetical protein
LDLYIEKLNAVGGESPAHFDVALALLTVKDNYIQKCFIQNGIF